MKYFYILLFFTVLSCSKINKTQDTDDQTLALEILAIEKTNKLFRNNYELLKTDLPETFKENSSALSQIKNFKEDLRRGIPIGESKIDVFVSSFKTVYYIPDSYFELLKKHSNSSPNQYKYIMLIENSLYQEMLSELTGSFYRFDLISPFVLTDKHEYNLGDEVHISIGYSGINTVRPLYITILNKEIPITEFGPVINLKADSKGKKVIKGTLRSTISEEYSIPFEVEYLVK